MIKTVNWNGNELHCIEWLIDGEVEWCFIAKEVHRVLGYSKNDYKTRGTSKTIGRDLARHCDSDEYLNIKSKELKEKLNVTETEVFEIGRKGETLLLETGVYGLILGSELPEAKEFKKFIKQLLKQLREKSGLEQFEAFRMMDKQVQLNVQKVVAEIGDLDNGGKNCIVMNNNVNKLISCELFGFNKALSKAEMEKYEPAMMIDRQEVLNKYMDYIIASDGSHKKAYELCSKWIKFKYGHLLVS